MSLRDEDAWTGELMAIVDQNDSDEPVAEAVVVEDESEPQHVVQNGTASPANGTANGSVNGKLRPFAPQPKAEPVVQKPQPPRRSRTHGHPAAGTDHHAQGRAGVPRSGAGRGREDRRRQAGRGPAGADRAGEEADACVRAAVGLAGGRERTAKTLADAIASSEPMAARFIEQYETEHGVVFASQN